MTTAENLVSRAANVYTSVYDFWRACALSEKVRLEHAIRTKADIDPSGGELAGRSGFDRLWDSFLASAALPRIGAAQIPFESPSAVLTAPPSAAWVGAGGAVPVTQAAFATVRHAPTKVSSIAVLTKESLRWSGPDADEAMRRTFVFAATSAVNAALLSDAPASPDVSPAGVGAGLVPIPATGLSEGEVFEDLIELVGGFDSPVLVASLPYALRIRAALRGATELPVRVAPEAGDRVYAFDRFALAFSLGRIDVDFSGETSLAMSDTPSSPANHVSMFQANSIAARVSVFANWTTVRPGGVRILEYEAS